MPFSGERAATDLAEWVRGVPILGLLIDNVLLAAAFITAIALVVVMATYWYQPVSSGGWRGRLRVAIYTFLGVFAILFIQHQGVVAKQSEVVRGGREMHTFVGAMSGKPRYRSENLQELIVRTDRTGGGADSDSESSDSESDSDSDSDSDSVRSRTARGVTMAPSSREVTEPLVPAHRAAAQPAPVTVAPPAPVTVAPPAPVVVAPAAPVVAGYGGPVLGVPPVSAAVDWRTGAAPLPTMPQYVI
jgi:hypothetical protein